MHEFKHPNYYKELRKRNKLAESRQPVAVSYTHLTLPTMFEV